MTTSKDLLDATAEALGQQDGQYATDAAGRVYKPGDWPTWDGHYPVLKLRMPQEQKTSPGRADINFTTVATIRVIGQVSAPAAADDGGAGVAEEALWRLQRQVEVAVINSLAIMQLGVQQFPTVTAQLVFNSEGETHLAGIQIDIAMEFYQGGEDFAPIATDPLSPIAGTVPTEPNLGFSVTLPS